MQNDLHDYLASQIGVDSIAELCHSLNEIGPYVSDLSFANPLTVRKFMSYVTVQVTHPFQLHGSPPSGRADAGKRRMR